MGSGNNIPATIDEVYETVFKLSKDTGISMYEIDLLVWNFCSSGYGEICISNPRCEICPIKEYCNK
jgi:endonuclease III